MNKYSGLSNEEYWKLRQQELVDESFIDLKKTERVMNTEYNLAFEQIQQQLESFYQRYADDNGLTLAQAQQLLNSLETINYQTQIEALKRQMRNGYNPLAQAELDRIIAQQQVTRLNLMLFQIDKILIDLAGSQQITFEDVLGEKYEQMYYQTGYMGAVTGVSASFATINQSVVTEAINYNWSGEMFTERIWNNRYTLVRKMKEIITQGLIRGESVQKMARNLKNQMNGSYKNSLRLLRTETAQVLSQASAKGYEQMEVKKYVFMSELSKTVCDVCGALDGKEFEITGRLTGSNYPPIHANCKCTVIPKTNHIPTLRRARNDEGKNEVIEYISYEDWKKTLK